MMQHLKGVSIRNYAFQSLRICTIDLCIVEPRLTRVPPFVWFPRLRCCQTTARKQRGPGKELWPRNWTSTF